MADRELNINLRLNRSQATTEAERFEQGEKLRIRNVERAHQDAETAKLSGFKRSVAERTRLAEQAATLEVSGFKRTRDAAIAATEATGGLGKALGGLAGSYAGVQGLTAAFDKLRQAVVAAKTEARNFAEKSVLDAGNLRELAATRGVAPDARLAASVARSAARAFATPANAQAFLTGLEGSSGDAKARMGEQEFDRFKIDALRLGESTNTRPDVMASFAGQVLRAGKFTTAKAARDALAGSMAMLQASPGAMPRLIDAANQIMSRVGSDENLSQLTDARDVMPLVSIAEVTKEGQGGAYAENALKAIKLASQSERGKAIGLDPTANVVKTLPPLVAYLKDQAKTRPLFDVMETDFGVKDVQAAAVLSTIVQQSDTFLPSLANARQPGAGGQYFESVTRLREQTREAQVIRARADEEAAQLEQADATGAVEKLKLDVEARTRMIRSGATAKIGGQLSLVGAQIGSLGSRDEAESARLLEQSRAMNPVFGGIPLVSGLGAGAGALAGDVAVEMLATLKQILGIQQAQQERQERQPPPALTP